MAQQLVDLGLAADDNNGDPGRIAFSKLNDNCTELYGLIDGTTSFEGLFKSSAPGTGIAFDFDSENAITTGKLFNFSSAGADILSLLDDGSESTLKFGQANIFGNTNIETSSPLGEFTFKEAAGGTMTIGPQGGNFTTSKGAMVFTASGGEVFTAANTTFSPGTTNTVSLGTAIKKWSRAFIVDRIDFGLTSQSSIKFNTDGLTIADAAGEKLAFFNTTPVVQPTALTAADATALDGTIATNDTVTDNIRTRVNELETKLKALGLIA